MQIGRRGSGISNCSCHVKAMLVFPPATWNQAFTWASGLIDSVRLRRGIEPISDLKEHEDLKPYGVGFGLPNHRRGKEDSRISHASFSAKGTRVCPILLSRETLNLLRGLYGKELFTERGSWKLKRFNGS